MTGEPMRPPPVLLIVGVGMTGSQYFQCTPKCTPKYERRDWSAFYTPPQTLIRNRLGTVPSPERSKMKAEKSVLNPRDVAQAWRNQVEQAQVQRAIQSEGPAEAGEQPGAPVHTAKHACNRAPNTPAPPHRCRRSTPVRLYRLHACRPVARA